MLKQRLDDADIDPVLNQMRRKTVPQRVRPDPLTDACGQARQTGRAAPNL